MDPLCFILLVLVQDQQCQTELGETGKPSSDFLTFPLFPHSPLFLLFQADDSLESVSALGSKLKLKYFDQILILYFRHDKSFKPLVKFRKSKQPTIGLKCNIERNYRKRCRLTKQGRSLSTEIVDEISFRLGLKIVKGYLYFKYVAAMKISMKT